MAKIKITITDSNCRSGYLKKEQEFIIEDICPPICHELWNCMYPLVYALKNGATLDYGNTRAKMFDVKCPDGGRVCVHGEVLEDWQIPIHKGGYNELHTFNMKRKKKAMKV